MSCKLCAYRNLCKDMSWFCVWPVWLALIAAVAGITYLLWSDGFLG